MILDIFSVYDSKAKAFLPPFFMVNSMVARRSFGEAANDANHQFCKHPEDYTLFKIGTWDDSTCAMELHKVHTDFGLAANYRTAYNVEKIVP